MEKKNIKKCYDLSKMGFYLCVFVALFCSGAFFQVYYYYPSEDLVFGGTQSEFTDPNITTNRYIGLGSNFSEITIPIISQPTDPRELESQDLKVLYFNIITRSCIVACIMGLLIAFFQYKLDPENHVLNKTLNKLKKIGNE